ncbi:MAG: hypothetical protein C0404_13015, partial [Verrucomicrobia bacterium]|nr:hypothetical protein [Verrucomicrobiota bacterium]
DSFGYKDQALFALSRGDRVFDSALSAQMLYDTGRVREAETLARRLGAKLARSRTGSPQRAFLPQAENAVSIEQWPAPLTAEQMKAEARQAELRAQEAQSPFMASLEKLTAGWLDAAGQADVSAQDRWAASGRNNLEKGAALHRLVMLSARQRHYGQASSAVDRALVHLPRSPVLWRMRIALGRTPGDVDRARSMCPDDPEIWLAAIVTRFAKDGPGAWAAEEARKAVAARNLPAEAMIRAGDFMLRHGMPEAAAACAKDVMAKSPGFVPASVLGMRCALATQDLKWATECALNGAANGLDPSPFYKAVVAIGAARNITDMSVVAALEFLHGRYPGESEWAERLAFAYFNRGDYRRASVLLLPVVERGRGAGVEAMLVVAEALRLEGEDGRAVEILEAARKAHPESLSVLNNLVYNLARGRHTAGRAMELLPELIAKAGDRPSICDTAALTYMRNGQLERASAYMEKALKQTARGSYAALETELNAAELLLLTGDLRQAKQKLEAIRRNAGCPPLVDVEARRMIERIEARQIK